MSSNDILIVLKIFLMVSSLCFIRICFVERYNEVVPTYKNSELVKIEKNNKLSDPETLPIVLAPSPISDPAPDKEHFCSISVLSFLKKKCVCKHVIDITPNFVLIFE